VNSHINRLRAKVEPDPANPRYVLTVRGVGYKFAVPGS
jgi:two-component system response regulator RegX3